MGLWKEIWKSKVLASDRIDRKEVKENYERKVCERLREVSMTVEEEESASEVFGVLKEFLKFYEISYNMHDI